MLKKIFEKINMRKNEKIGYDKWGRPCKELYFMNLAFEIATRSIDPDTKHGCVATNEEGRIISTGYNGPVIDSDDNLWILERPHKYYLLEHSERNMIYSATNMGNSLKGARVYVTGLPCIDCLRGMKQSGIQSIIYGPLISISSNDFSDKKRYYDILLSNGKMSVTPFKYKDILLEYNPRIKTLLEGRIEINERWG